MSHFTYMIHSVRELLWKGVGKSGFHCLRKHTHTITPPPLQKNNNQRANNDKKKGDLHTDVAAEISLVLDTTPNS